jgi:hypothetical protein
MRDKEIVDGKWKGNFPCPDCGSSDNLSIYEKESEDGEIYYDGSCWSCTDRYKSPKRLKELGYEAGNFPEFVSSKEDDFDMTDIADILKLDVRGVRERKIKKQFAEMYGMRVSYNTETGEIDAHYYPCTKDGEITGFFKRTLPKQFSAVGDVKKIQLQGQHLFDNGGEYENVAGKKFVMVTEGFLDMLAAQQMMQENRPDFITAIVSLPNGINPKSVKENYEFLNKFETVLICVDQDDVGQKGARELCKALPMGKTKIMSFSEKDPCDMLKKGKSKEFYKAFWNAKPYSPAGILDGQGLWGLVSNVDESNSVPYPWDGLTKITHGIRTGEMVTLTAGCVDADTEFLTPTGWKRIADYEEGDKVAQYHENDTISFIEPLKYHKYEADKLWSIKTKYGVDQVLSDEHNVVYLSDKHNICKKSLKDIRDVQEKSVRGFGGRFITTFGRNVGGVGVPLSEEDIRVMVAVMADGHFSSVRLKKDRKKDRLAKLLSDAGISYTRKQVAPYDGFETFRFYAPLRMKTYEGFWWEASKEQLKVICEECVHWDGNQTNHFYSSVKEDVDFLQYAFASIGKRSTVLVDDRECRYTDKPCYVLRVAGNNTVGIKADKNNKPVFEEYETKDGFKYCFTTETGMWVMRRNFRICVTGNSGVAKSTFARKILHHLLKCTEDNIGGMFLEESVKRTALSIMSIEANKLLHLPDVERTQEEMKDAFDKTLGTGRVFLYDHFGSVDIDTIVENITYFVRAADVKYVFLDHISIMVSAGGHGDERKALDEICTKLRTLVQELDICLFIISHLKRPSDGRGHETGAETSLAQLRGSAGIAQLSDMVIGFERNGQAEDPVERNTTTVRVLKNRFSGETGVATKVLYNNVTGALVEVKDVDESGDMSDFFPSEGEDDQSLDY